MSITTKFPFAINEEVFAKKRMSKADRAVVRTMLEIDCARLNELGTKIQALDSYKSVKERFGGMFGGSGIYLSRGGILWVEPRAFNDSGRSRSLRGDRDGRMMSLSYFNDTWSRMEAIAYGGETNYNLDKDMQGFDLALQKMCGYLDFRDRVLDSMNKD